MCLIDKKQFRIAEKDIPIFKVIENKFGIIQSPFQHIPYKTLPVIESSNIEFEPSFLAQQNSFQYGFGFIHAYLNEEIAKKYLNKLHSLPGSRIFCLCKGYIPQGTRYATDECEYICARKIILNL